MSSLLNSKIYLIPLVIVGLGVMTVASAQTSGSPFSSKKKKQAWEVNTPPAPRSNSYSGSLDRLPTQNVPVNTAPSSNYTYSPPIKRVPSFETNSIVASDKLYGAAPSASSAPVYDLSLIHI